ncbi:DNA ligase D [Methylocapsa sp. S129]|uniref:DNA ligase D n=1 Tax=Methylocapsa sp. S129 TaxID=1641869 RepID=UPI00131E7557|nr:DNA ligase D [Methylocapsa sp. S129]
MAELDLYHAKRDFRTTSEPRGAKARHKPPAKGGVFVIQKHAARRLHYDLRLEHDGVLWSWAVTRGPSLDPSQKRLAVHVEDHPFDYRTFEGVIPKGQYGGGSVIIWDEGRWLPQDDPAAAMKKGHISFELEGRKLRGLWHLVRLKPRGGEKRDNWLLMKADDEAARPDEDILETEPNSVKSGLSIEQIGAGEKALAARGRSKAPVAPKQASKAAKTAPMPDFVAPCLATLAAHAPEGKEWLHEVKFDGYRIEARIEAGKVKLFTRTGLDWSARFGANVPKALADLACDNALIDGEVVVLADNGVSSFSALQAALSEGRTANMVYFAFDLLYVDGEDLRREPALARKERLESLLHAAGDKGALRYSEHFVAPGETMLRQACRMGLEGVVSKRAGAPYHGGRSQDWIKSKCTQRQEFLIAGYVASKAAGRALASLVLGYHDGKILKAAGRVGTGFTEKSAADLMRKLKPLRTKASAFEGVAGKEKGIVWVRPELVAEIEFRAWTADGILRHASFQGLREDKPAAEVVAEKPAKTDAPRKAKRRADAPAAAKAGESETEVKLTHPDKVLWPDAGVTKAQLLAYYQAVWPRMRPYVIERPLSLVRAPNGVKGQRFFQKHASPGLHSAIAVAKDAADGEDLLFIRDFDGIAALVQLGVVEIHIWGCKIDAIETPDQIVFDLDPDEGLALEKIRDAAVAIRDRLKDLGLESFPKTSGGKGFHVVAPLQPKAGWESVKNFAHDFAKAMEQQAPKSYTATLAKATRKGRIFIDYLRNGRGATAVAPYSARANAAAAVSMPISWTMVEQGAAPGDFDVLNVLSGKKAMKDAWASYASAAAPLGSAD